MTTNKYVFKLSLSRCEAPALSGAFAASPLLPSFGFTTTAHAQSSKESTIAIVDELEREVRLRAPVKAVYPDLRYQTEIVRAIGADDTIVAIEQTSNPNKNPANKDYFAKLADLPDAGNFNGPNWERLPHRARKSSLPAAPPWFCRSPRPAISMQGRSSWPASRSRSSSARSPPASSILPRTRCWPRSRWTWGRSTIPLGIRFSFASCFWHSLSLYPLTQQRTRKSRSTICPDRKRSGPALPFRRVPRSDRKRQGPHGARSHNLPFQRRRSLVPDRLGRNIADQLQDRYERGATDGFNFLAFTLKYELRLSAVTDHLIPELQRRGIFHHDYQHETLRQNFGV